MIVLSLELSMNQLIRCLLGVRKNTSIELCLVEAGIPPIHHVLAKRRQRFIESKMVSNDPDHPFTIVLRLLSDNKIPLYQFISHALQFDTNSNPFSNLKTVINEKAVNRTKFNTYVSKLNTPLTIHPIYLTSAYIPDYQREAFSRIRLMSHRLKIETGRWSRIPHERRVCQCNDSHPQTEEHVLMDCHLSETIRNQYPLLDFTSIHTLLSEATHMNSLCKYVHEILCFYK